MSLSQSPVLKSDASRGVRPHIHAAGETCPTCDQPIPHDRFDEIKERIETRQSARAEEIAARLQDQFTRDKAEALEQVGREAAAALKTQVASARAEERQAAEAAANQKLADAERISKDAQVAMQARIEEAEAAKAAAEGAGSALRAELEQARRDNEAAIRKVKEEAKASAVAIREDALKHAEAGVQEKLAAMERARQESESALQARIEHAEVAKAAAQQSSENLQAQLNQVRLDGEAAVEKVRQEAQAQVLAARQEIAASVESAMQERIANAEQAKSEAEEKALAAEESARMFKETHEAQVTQRLNEQREILERAQTEAVNSAKSEAFEEKMKLSNKVTELQRALDKKTAEEHGEGAEINLFEVLKSEFEEDRVERVGKGRPGADILQTVIHNGQECGKIIYDSKDHNAWRNDFVAKLTSDKLAAQAEHAVLSVRKFPQGTRQLHVQDGVILASPSRVAALVQILRQSVIQSHTLRLSNEARTQKTAALYSFITSEQSADLFRRIDVQTENLLEMKVSEIKYHESMWKKQSEAIRLVQKARADLSNHIEIIIGTADATRQAIRE